ncbi:MarR family winged helix-turn-helix transcriptional regulator [Streptomyces profundus]|uniref:MarR family winged helix-turn-helix transcriptional regulator n=1 Tax=Streptomyces profundus TaxID=2867410 RepID=UPI001D16B42A|nr:MarR family transcriptional regulator [Streptomyces sp. MA3_2.13]UED87813.1 MarR family transcriptional regulator [Streptomyces sp. MA3_2.13]
MTDDPPADARRPLGYWLKHIDWRVEERFGRLLAEEGLGRRHWQVCTTLARGPIGAEGLDHALAPFLSAREPTVRPYVDQLVGRGWAMPSAGGAFTLTEEGRARHAAVAERVDVFRARVVAGLSPAEYATLLGLLERVADNLDDHFEDT